MGRWGDGEIKTPRNKNLLHSFSCVSLLLDCFILNVALENGVMGTHPRPSPPVEGNLGVMGGWGDEKS
ncbi:hypothetical protein [Okeania sp. KiyG1]|uniref:hypothetical protein n=1 Tax=Okeania sp. KiyG1 TaxID=2720165 RepID=UPI001922A213|nr:hypothetical protein [Okeania sp. KiyG1]